jgi:vacuolar-type H+-ATPase subunit I/STV1
MKHLVLPVLVAAITLAASGCDKQEAKTPAVPDEFAMSPPNASLAEKQAQLAKIRAETARLEAQNEAMMDKMDPDGRAARLQLKAEKQAQKDKEKAEQGKRAVIPS